MTIPHEKEYSSPYLSARLICINCSCRGEGVRRLNREHRKVTDYKLFWLCPKCFKKLILGKGREEVEFT